MSNKILSFIGVIFGFFLFSATLYGLLVLYEKFNRVGHDVVVTGEVQQKNLLQRKVVIGDRSFEVSFSPDGIKVPPTLLFNIIANGTMKVTFKKAQKLIYDVTYTFNPWGLRNVERQFDNAQAEYLIIGPCSFSLGEGLQDKEQISSYLEQRDHRFNNYNLGVMGGGLHTLFQFFRNIDVSELVQEDNGVFVYVYIQNHLNRWFLRPDFLQWADKNSPVFNLENGTVNYKGFLKDQEKYLDFQTGISADRFLRHRDSFTEDEYEEFAKAISKFKELYLAKFPGGKFFFLIHPENGVPAKELPILKAKLEENGIEVWSFSLAYENLKSTLVKTSEDFMIPVDGHPNALMNEFIAEEILRRL